jgi:glycosyltransferase involved in cell wall biosynthesis
MKKTISIILPVFNEEENILPAYQELVRILESRCPTHPYELIYVNDGSTDRSGEVINQIASRDQRVKYLEFSRNFGKEKATSAGLFHAKGDAAMLFDVDLQFPPELIPYFIRKWEAGADVVIGIRTDNKSQTFLRKVGSKVFNRIMNIIGNGFIPEATDYRLIDRTVIDEFNKLTERNRITRGLIDWLGFKRDFIHFSANERKHGEAKFNLLKLIKLTFSSIVSLSLLPLRISGFLGGFLTMISGPLGLFMVIEKYILGDPFGFNFSGPASLAVLIVFAIGIVLISLGAIAMYIEQIHSEAINRPMYIIKSKQNFDNENQQIPPKNERRPGYYPERGVVYASDVRRKKSSLDDLEG